jgi:hypothetical protein
MGNRRKETGDRRKGDAIPVPILLFRILIFQESGERRDGKQEKGDGRQEEGRRHSRSHSAIQDSNLPRERRAERWETGDRRKVAECVFSQVPRLKRNLPGI